MPKFFIYILVSIESLKMQLLMSIYGKNYFIGNYILRFYYTLKKAVGYWTILVLKGLALLLRRSIVEKLVLLYGSQPLKEDFLL